jgi:hypothetical protein
MRTNLSERSSGLFAIAEEQADQAEGLALEAEAVAEDVHRMCSRSRRQIPARWRQHSMPRLC